MSWWIKECILQDNEGYRVFNIECDDVASLPAYNSQSPDFIISRGSKAFVLATSETYCLNSTNQWIKLKDDGGGGTITLDAEYVGYDNTDSGLTATNVQDAIDELETEIENLTPSGNVQAVDVDYDNTDSGLVATNVQDAIDEVQGNVETVETTANSALQPSDVTSTYSSSGTDPVNGTAVASALSNSGFITAGTTLSHYGIADAYISGGTITLGNNSITPGTSNFSGSFNDLTNKPTTIAGYGITDAFSGSFTDLTDKPTTISGYGITDAYISGGTITLGSNSITPGTSNFSGAFNDLTGKPTTLAGYGITDASISNGTITLGNNTLTPGTSNFSGAFVDLTGKPTTLSGYGITDANISSGVITLGSNTITPLTSSDVTSTYSALGTDPVNGIAVAAALAGGGGGDFTFESFTLSEAVSSQSWLTKYNIKYDAVCINETICVINLVLIKDPNTNTKAYYNDWTSAEKILKIDNPKYNPLYYNTGTAATATINASSTTQTSGKSLGALSKVFAENDIGYIGLLKTADSGYNTNFKQINLTISYLINTPYEPYDWVWYAWDSIANTMHANPSNYGITEVYYTNNASEVHELPGGEGHSTAIIYTYRSL